MFEFINALKTYKWPFLISLGVLVVGGSALWGFSIFQNNIRQGQIEDYLYRASQAKKTRNYPQAFELLEKAHKLDPKNNYYTLRQADVAFLNADYQIAVDLYEQAEHFDQAETLYYQALQDLSQLDYNSALKKLKLAQKKTQPERPLSQDKLKRLIKKVQDLQSKDNPSLQHALTGKLLIEERAFNLAVTNLKQLTSKEPQYRDAHYLLGVAYLREEKLARAREALKKSLEIDPTYQAAQELLEQAQN